MKNTSKLIALLFLLSIGCDEVKDDSFTPLTIEYETVKYARPDGSIIIPVFGDFIANDITVNSNSEKLSKVEAQIDLEGVTFLKYSSNDDPTDLIDLQIIENNSAIATGTLEIRSLASDDCVNSGFSDLYTIKQGETLEVDLTENDAFCGFFDSGSRAVNEVPISNAEGAQIAVAPGTATLTYTPPAGFSGHVELIYEICFGWAEIIGAGNGDEIFKNGQKNCEFYYTALATIEVI